MKIKESSRFKREFKKYISSDMKILADYVDVLESFKVGDISELSDRRLSRDLKNCRAFSVTDDIRVIYKETKYGYYFMRVGPHDVVY